MRTIGLIGSLAALALGAPAAAQGFRIDDRIPSAVLGDRIPRAVLGDQEPQTSGKKDKVPPGHLPPAGMCRVWIDGVPAGRQPAPTDCQTAVATKPANARVIWGDETPFPGKGKNKSGSLDRRQDDDDRDRAVKDRDRDDDAKGKSKTNKGKGRGRGRG